MSKIRVGIIGCGGICKFAHVPSYLALDRVEVAALCDTIPERAESLRSRFFKKAAVYSDYNDLLADSSIDYVDICTPNYLHSIIAVAAFEAGKHVLCEKPDAISVEEAQKMSLAADKAGKKLMVIRNNRFFGPSQTAKKLIDAGEFGDIYAGRCGWVRRRGIPGKGGWFTTKAMSGGGPLIDLGVHMVDLSMWLMGNPTPVSVSGSTYCKFADSSSSDSAESRYGDKVKDGTFDVEDLALGLIRFDNGALLQIEFSWASNIKKEHRFVELRGTKAGLEWKNGKAERFFEKNGRQVNEKIKGKKVLIAHKENISHFLDVLEGKAEPIFVPGQGVDMIKILCAMYESAQSEREVLL